jgi:4-amino-4-deoxy-L-arabinose transferase-like glycosyltransferase
VQPEALLLLAGSLTLERGVAWHDHGRRRDLALVALGLGLASLIKVLPLIWLGLPLLWLGWCRHGRRLVGRPGPWLVLLAVVAVTTLWYAHAHGLYRSTGLSFGFWGARASRYSWADLLGPGYWGDVLLRFAVRGLAVLGLVPLVLGWRRLPATPESRILPIGLGAVLLAGALAPASSHIHEYYQLPLLLFACPLVGLGCTRLAEAGRPGLRRLLPLGLGLVLTTSLLILGVDYWGREQPAGDPTWALAQRVRRETPAGALLVSVTGGDPTLLYLSHRKGWLQQPGAVDAALLQQRQLEGATHVVGLWKRIESYQPFTDGPDKARLRRLLDGDSHGGPGVDGYVLPLPLGTAQ